MIRLASAVTIFAAFASGAVAQDDGERKPIDPLSGPVNEARADEMDLAPPVRGDELRQLAVDTYARGWKFVVESQNADGSWGSHDPQMAFLKDFGFQTINRGSQDGVRHACTAIIAKALLAKDDRTEAEQHALDRAAELLLSTQKFAYHLGEAFNTWGYGYKLDFLCDYLESPLGESRRDAIMPAAEVCVQGLLSRQHADGGWNYYGGVLKQSPSMSFNTANFIEALARAENLGVEVPAGMVGDATKLIKRMVTERGGVVYDGRFMNDGGSVNELSAGSRTAAVTEALAEVGEMGRDEMLRSLALFNEGENWLEDGRKLIQPHTAVHQISGYFFFYGYHYLSEFLTRIAGDVPADRWERIAWTMIRTQEDNGAWWDTAAADYGDKWATGFALLSLQRYFEHTPGTVSEGE